MFWTKCDKIMLNSSGSLERCDDCPCGYWGIFVIVVYSKSYKKGEQDSRLTRDNYCYKNLTTTVFQVTDNTVDLASYIDYRGEKLCVKLSRTADPATGIVASVDKDIKDPASSDCDEWNDDYTVCLKPAEWRIHYEIKVYRIGDAYDDYTKFARYFYSGCGVSPDASGQYPAILELNYGRWTMTGSAQNCIYNYWQQEADRRYKPSCIINYDIYTWSFNLWYPSVECVEEEYCYNYCNGDCKAYDDEMNCTDCDGELVRSCETYCDHPIHDSILVNFTNEEQEYYYTIGGRAYFEDNVWKYESPDCCEFWSGTRSAVGQVNSYEERRTRPEHYNLDDSASVAANIPGSWGNMCWSGEHEAYHGNHPTYSQFWKKFQFAKLKFERGENTPPGASGVQVMITAYSHKTDDEDAIEKNVDTYMYENETVTFKFGEEKELPRCDNMRTYYIKNEQDCSEDCEEGGRPDLYPQGWHSTTEKFYVSLAVIRYVY